MVKLTSRLNTIPSFSRLLDKIEKAYKQDNEGDYQVYALAFFDRLFNQYQIDAVDVSEADVYAFPYNDDRIECVFNDTETGLLKLRTETDNVVIDIDEVCPVILFDLCKYLSDTDIIKIGVTR